MLMHKETPQISADYALDEGLNRFEKKKKPLCLWVPLRKGRDSP